MTAAALRALVRQLLVEACRRLRSRSRINVRRESQIMHFGTPGWDTFFGYHDITPFGPGDRLLLAARRPVAAGVRAAGTELQLGCFDLSNARPQFIPFGRTSAWCWQQGCRLQWYGQGSSTQVFFNTSEQGKHRSRIFDIPAMQVVATIDRAIYSLSGDGRWGVSLNFARLQRLRPGYGYDDVPDPTEGETNPSDDGLWLVDVVGGQSRLLVSLAEVAAFRPDASMTGAIHYFNHVLWSPGGKRFFFLHLWNTVGGKRRARAFIWDFLAGTYELLGPYGHVSHHCWLDDEHMIVYGAEPNRGQFYHRYQVGVGWVGTIGRNVLQSDGHPSISPIDPQLMVTDTYPDKFGEQALLIFRIDEDRLCDVARLYSPHHFRGQLRCDLHPRWSRAGDRICIDSAHAGHRQLCVLDVSMEVEVLHGRSAAQ